MEHFSSAVLSKVSYVDLSVMERPPSLTIVRKVVDVGVVVISSLGGGGGGGGGDIECVVRFEESRTFFSLKCLEFWIYEIFTSRRSYSFAQRRSKNL
jgi:hypothetical protein